MVEAVPRPDSTTRGPSTDRAFLHILFEEVNEHMRSTEAKQLEISVGYFALLAVALTLLATREGEDLLAARTSHLAVYGYLTILGCLVVYVQDSYRAWKMHYRIVARRIASQLSVDRDLLPHWLREAPYANVSPFHLSPDNALSYATGATSLGLTIAFNVVLLGMVEGYLGAALVFLSTASFTAFMIYVRAKGLMRVRLYRRLADEDTRLGRAP